MTEKKLTVIVGGTGKTGRRVAQRLERQGLAYRIAARSAAIPFDWSDMRTWRPALADAQSLYLAYSPDLAVPEAAPQVRDFTRMAADNGVDRIVLLSGRGEEEVFASEDAVRGCGAAYTILRCAWFCQNFNEGLLVDAVRSGELAFPAGSVAEPFIDADDIADVAVAALTSNAHAGLTYELTGPRLLTFAQAMSEISHATGRTARYVPISSQQYGEMLAPYMPPAQVSFFTSLFSRLLDGHNAYVTGDVERVIGRKPRDFSEYARHAAATGVWNS